MAYLARIEPQTAEPIALMGVPANDTAKPDFSRLEWSVIRLARVDSLGTLREPGRWGRFTVPGEDVASFFSAGFSPDQYELMVRSISAAISTPQGISA